MTFRKIVFWGHLATGVAFAAGIASMAGSGFLLAFEPQITEFSERAVRRVEAPAPDIRRLPASAIVRAASASKPDARASALTIRSDRAASAAVQFAKSGTTFVNPYTGRVLGGESRVHRALHAVEEWHRWLGSREKYRPLTGAIAAAFLAMLVSGLFLWWPRKQNQTPVRRSLFFEPRLHGRARDWNRHNVTGFWLAPLILLTTLTGLVMSYDWADRLVYRAAGSPPPAKMTAKIKKPSAEPDLDALWARSEAQTQGWRSIRLGFASKDGGPATAWIEERTSWGAPHRSLLSLDPSTAEILKWQPYASQDRGKKWRGWITPLHTGRWAGPAGQGVMALEALGALLLVWTGLSMAVRRWISFLRACRV